MLVSDRLPFDQMLPDQPESGAAVAEVRRRALDCAQCSLRWQRRKGNRCALAVFIQYASSLSLLTNRMIEKRIANKKYCRSSCKSFPLPWCWNERRASKQRGLPAAGPEAVHKGSARIGRDCIARVSAHLPRCPLPVDAPCSCCYLAPSVLTRVPLVIGQQV